MALERADAQSTAQITAPTESTIGIHGARDVHLNNSSITVAGRDVHHTHIHTHIHDRDISDDSDLKKFRDVLMKFLKSVSNFRRIHLDTLAKATKGTVQWLLECKEFRLFIDIDGHLKILWGSGMPGAGKTILASIVIDRLETLAKESNDQICVAYAYVRYSDQEVTIRGILESLVKQTVERHPDCVAIAQEVYERHIEEETRPSEEELCQLLSQFARAKKAMFYVLDALDEAPDKIRLNLIQRLSSLGVRLFITSRPLPTLETKLPGTFRFSISARDQDLELHINERISCSEHLQDLLAGSKPAFRQQLVSVIREKAGGMFLHASLQLNILQECFTTHAAKEALESFPASIEDVYQQTWDRITRSDKRQADLAKAAFTWILHAKQPLTVNQLRYALATCPETYHFESGRLMAESVILAACRGLIELDQESKLVRLVHYTTKEFLDNLFSTESYYPPPHSQLAAICATHLADQGFQNTTLRLKREFYNILKEHPLLDYAYDAWTFHATKSRDADLTIDIVSAFVRGCQAFPVSGELNLGFWQSLHIIAFHDLPLAFSKPFHAGNVNELAQGDGRSPLHLACEKGHYRAARSLLSLPGIQVNQVSGDGWTALMLASACGHEAVVRLLLTRLDLEVDLTTTNDYTLRKGIAKPSPFHIQANMARKSGQSALVCALENGHEVIVALLLAHSNLSSTQGSRVLIDATERGYEVAVKHLLTLPDIQVNMAADNGMTPLILALRNYCAKLPHPDIQVNLARGDGTAPQLMALRNLHDILRLLLAHPNIQVNLANRWGLTPLIYASQMGLAAAVELLSHPNVQVNLPDNNGRTALTYASMQGHKAVVKLLLTHPDIQVNLPAINGWTALMIASWRRWEEIVKLLLAHPKVDVNRLNAHGSTALLLSIQGGHTNTVKLLLAAHGTNVNSIDENGNTAIRLAAGFGRADVVRALLEVSDIDTSVRSKDGHTAMSIAVAKGHHAIVNLLNNHEAQIIDSNLPFAGQTTPEPELQVPVVSSAMNNTITDNGEEVNDSESQDVSASGEDSDDGSFYESSDSENLRDLWELLDTPSVY